MCGGSNSAYDGRRGVSSGGGGDTRGRGVGSNDGCGCNS